MIYDYMYYVFSRNGESTSFIRRSIVLSNYFDPIYYGCEREGVYTGYVHFNDGTKSSVIFIDERPPRSPSSHYSHYDTTCSIYVYSDDSDLHYDRHILESLRGNVHMVKIGAISFSSSSIHIGMYHMMSADDTSILPYIIGDSICPIDWDDIYSSSSSYIREMKSLLVCSNTTTFGDALLEKYMTIEKEIEKKDKTKEIEEEEVSLEEMEKVARSIWESLMSISINTIWRLW
jgi:hypothetical protein